MATVELNWADSDSDADEFVGIVQRLRQHGQWSAGDPATMRALLERAGVTVKATPRKEPQGESDGNRLA